MRPGDAFYVSALLLKCLGGCSCVSDAEASTRHTGPGDTAALTALVTPPALQRTPTAADADADGIDDERELSLARDYFPFFSVDSRESCSRHGVLFRVTPHPSDPKKIAIWYVVLFERDCGLRGIGAHAGDDEVFGELVDPQLPAPAGILGLRAISHQNTTCERVTACGSLAGCSPCSTTQKNGRAFPVVFSSSSKHGNYVDESTCNRWLCDFMGCSLNGKADSPAFTNAGEPGYPLSENLTTNGFINADNGWSDATLMNFNPWGNAKFGGAGNVTDDLTDSSFLISPSGC